MQEGNLDEARRSYQDSFDIRKRLVDDNPSNTEYQHDLSVSYGNLGDVRVEGRKAYRHSFDILKRLLDGDPDNVKYQRDRAKSYERLGDVLVQEHNLVEARNADEDSLDIRKSLAVATPTDANYQHDLAVTYGNLGDVPAEDNGSRQRSLNELRQGRVILKKLTELDPENVRWQKDLERLEMLLRKLVIEPSTLTDPTTAPKSAGGQ